MAASTSARRPPPALPSGAELDILAVLWRVGPVTARRVHKELGREIVYSDTVKRMQTMVEKDLLTHGKRDRSHIYEPTAPKEQIRKQIVEDLMERAFGGSSLSLVLSALSARPASHGELIAIRKVVDMLARQESAGVKRAGR